MRPRGPGLRERTRRGEKQIRKADAHREKQEDAADRRSRIRRLPTGARQDRRSPRQRERSEQEDGKKNETRMQRASRAGREPMCQDVGVEVSGEQGELEEEETGGPDRRPSSEPRQDVLAHERLDLKEKECPEEDRQGVEKHSRW